MNTKFAEFLSEALAGATGEGAICVHVRGLRVLLTEMRSYAGDDLPQACGRRYFHKLASWATANRPGLGTCGCAEEIERRGSVAGHLYPLDIYTCPNGHEAFYSRAAWGAVTWRCPDCQASGEYAGCDGEAHTWLRAARPVKGDPRQAVRWEREHAPLRKPQGTNGVQVDGWWV